MEKWRSLLRFDPLPNLLSSNNRAIVYFSKCELQNGEIPQVEALWELPSAKKLLRLQQSDGSWRYRGGKPGIRSQENYDQIETYRNLGELVEKYGYNRGNASIGKAADFLLGFQTQEGDIRGIYGNQFSPNYTAAIMELLIKAGYENDPRLERGFRWLLRCRQDDGGWAIPIRTRQAKIPSRDGSASGSSWIEVLNLPPIDFDKTKPFSHLVTGVVLRAFAAHTRYRQSEEAKAAGSLLASRFFKRDAYVDRGTVDFWTKFSYPFWFTDLLSSLDSLSLLGFSMVHPQVKLAIDWFSEQQLENGLWKLHYVRGKDKDTNLWIDLAICRVIKRLCAI